MPVGGRRPVAAVAVAGAGAAFRRVAAVPADAAAPRAASGGSRPSGACRSPRDHGSRPVMSPAAQVARILRPRTCGDDGGGAGPVAGSFTPNRPGRRT